MRRLAIVAAVALALTATSAAAQPTIPYDGHEIEPEAGKGPVQCVVWERDENRHADPDGVTMDAKVDGVVIFNDSDHGWIMVGHAKREAVGAWNLQVGDDCTDALLGER